MCCWKVQDKDMTMTESGAGRGLPEILITANLGAKHPI
jgi:hypothetical protein